MILIISVSSLWYLESRASLRLAQAVHGPRPYASCRSHRCLQLSRNSHQRELVDSGYVNRRCTVDPPPEQSPLSWHRVGSDIYSCAAICSGIGRPYQTRQGCQGWPSERPLSRPSNHLRRVGNACHLGRVQYHYDGC
ncbi:hypothetical protein CALCODRAFT_37649 [Calocera cornea HHB12733]|uniref:Uncharacterized protein n=1 Tax=Calocera cornea HHB12733 TaxID=1353952 RepID=A0A165DXX7_9BASI|nr:hypothetical protein CALCODRAFT_37649 [Calocera cornea HHB12733]